MQELMKNKLFLAVMAFMALNVFAFFGSRVVVDKTTDRVIEKLQKEYSPSPYGPGVDPDRVNVEAIRPKMAELVELAEAKEYLEMRQGESAIQYAPTLRQIADISWRDEWEAERGFNPAQ